MRALNNYVLLEKIKGTPREIAGLEVVEAVDTEGRFLEGKVCSVPKDFQDVLEVGEIVLYDKVAGHDVRGNDGEVYRLVRIGDIPVVL